MTTIFTKIVQREIPAHIVAEDEHFLAFLDIFPCNIGHTLVIPKLEVDYLFDLAEEDYLKLMSFTKRVERAIKKAVPCQRIGMAVIGLEVPHAHIHLVPINKMSDMDFTNKLKISKEELAATAQKISSFFE